MNEINPAARWPSGDLGRGPLRPRAPKHRQLQLAAFLILVCLLVGCRSTGVPIIPPVTQSPTNEIRVGKFVWVDLVTRDLAKSMDFYSALFGWTFDGSERYQTILNQGVAIGGMLPTREEGRQSEWIGNLSVADVDEAVRVVEERGGVVERPAVDAPDRGRIALVSDAEGALMLLVRAAGGDPPDREPVMGSWVWWELWSKDGDLAARFYEALVGYAAENRELDGTSHVVMMTGETPRAEVVAAPDPVKPLWLPYVRVDDLDAYEQKAQALGARIVVEGPSSTIFIDPTGAPLGILAWDFERDGAEGQVQ